MPFYKIHYHDLGYICGFTSLQCGRSRSGEGEGVENGEGGGGKEGSKSYCCLCCLLCLSTAVSFFCSLPYLFICVSIANILSH